MLRPGQFMVCCALALLCVGVVMVNSAGLDVVSAEPITPRDVLLSRSSTYMGLALVTMGLVSFLPVRSVARALAPRSGDHPDAPRHTGLLTLGTLLLLAILASVYVPGLGRSVNGAYRWIGLTLPRVGYVSIQPSEIVKWLILGLVSWHGASLGTRMGSFARGLAPALVSVGLIAGLMAIEDLGTAALIVAASGVVLVAAGARLWQMLALSPIAAAGVAGGVALEPYRFERLRTFLDPFVEPEGAGYHMIQSMATVAGGGGWGRGLGNGLQKFGYLPEDQTDFLLAIIAEELGIAGAGLVVALLLGLIWAGWAIARREPDPMLKLVAIGVLATIGLQATINIAVVVGWAPTKGIPLPLVSAGGTGWILTAGSLGLLVSMDRSRAHATPLPDSATRPADSRSDERSADADSEDAWQEEWEGEQPQEAETPDEEDPPDLDWAREEPEEELAWDEEDPDEPAWGLEDAPDDEEPEDESWWEEGEDDDADDAHTPDQREDAGDHDEPARGTVPRT